MTIAIISDIHENFHNLILALQEIEKRGVEQIICLGDLMNAGVAKILAAQDVPVFMIWGNNDGEKVDITLASKREGSSLTVSLNTYDFLEFDGKCIFVCHYDDLAIPMAKSGDFNAVFYGHNHLESVAKIEHCWVVNPGEIAAMKTKRATFALYDTSTNEVEILELTGAVHLKTPLMEKYFKMNAEKMGFRSAAAFGIELIPRSFIPESSNIFKKLKASAQSTKIVVFSGLPGVGKSLYVNQFKQLAQSLDKTVTVIQWDVARKAFETPEISQRFPTGESMVHNGLKLSVGKWLLDTVKSWLEVNEKGSGVLLIEAPLVGHRFVELAQRQEDSNLEAFLGSEACQFIVPIPSRKVREKIEADRKAQVSEDAKNWSGAKHSVMELLWKMIGDIANTMGKQIPIDAQLQYEPEIYEFVFSKVLKHRHMVPLYIEEIFDIEIDNEDQLHEVGSIKANSETANKFGKLIMDLHPTDETIDPIVNDWFNT
jgi:putative phosphoesterase